MARRKQAGASSADGKFYDTSRETWLTEADHAAVAATGTDPDALCMLACGPRARGHQVLRFQALPADRRQDWALANISCFARRRAIGKWARANGVDIERAVAHFNGEPGA